MKAGRMKSRSFKVRLSCATAPELVRCSEPPPNKRLETGFLVSAW